MTRPIRQYLPPFLAMLLLVIAVAQSAMADYLTVSRHALVRQSPQRDALEMASVERGDVLVMASAQQTHGYYRVAINDGHEGWIYRTFVRRVKGSPPDVAHAAEQSLPPSTETSGGDSPFTYAGNPVSAGSDALVRVLEKPFFTVGYSEEQRNPLWVCYAIGPATDLRTHARKNSFATDENTQAKVKHSDYTGSGFSRGHMAPKFAIGARFGKAGSDSTFVMSNVCPQFQDFNDGQWGDLEEMIGGTKRANGDYLPGWADEYEFLWVMVGPIFDHDREPLESGVEVPSAFYCIVIDEESGKPRALAFILDHLDQRPGDLQSALHSIDEVEERTGLDFFSRLPDDIESSLESGVALEIWPSSPHPQ